MYYKIVKIIKEEFGDNLLSIILFGSKARGFKGNDLDLIIILKEMPKNLKEVIMLKKNFEKKISKTLNINVDLHFFTEKSFKENLDFGSFLVGLSLGYKILFDKINVEKYIKEFLERIEKENIVYVDKYGEWDVGKIAKIINK